MRVIEEYIIFKIYCMYILPCKSYRDGGNNKNIGISILQYIVTLFSIIDINRQKYNETKLSIYRYSPLKLVNIM